MATVPITAEGTQLAVGSDVDEREKPIVSLITVYRHMVGRHGKRSLSKSRHRPRLTTMKSCGFPWCPLQPHDHCRQAALMTHPMAARPSRQAAQRRHRRRPTPEELRLQKSLLFFATGLICLASMVWLLIYWQLGPRFSSNLPFALQLLLVGNLLVYLKTLNFNAFR
jgi:hypothetical protein